MADPRLEQIERIKRKEQIARIREKESSSPAPEAPEPSFMDQAKSFGGDMVDMVKGFRPAEDIPIAGPLAAKAGNAAQSLITGEPMDDIEYRDRQQQKDYRTKFPHAAFYKQALGSVAAPVPEGGAVTGLAEKAVGPARNLFSRGVAGLTNIGERAALSGGETYADQKLRGEDNAGDTATNAAQISTAMNLLPKALKYGGAATTMLTSGVKPSTWSEYRQKRPILENLNEEGIASDISKHAGNALAEGDTIKNDALRSAQDQKTMAMNREKEAVGDIKGRISKAGEASEAQADQIVRQVSDDLLGSRKGARTAVSNASSDAFDQLEKSGITVPKALLKQAINRKKRSLMLPGGAPPPDPTELNMLQTLSNIVDQHPDRTIPGKDMKRYQQVLGEMSDEMWNKRNTPGSYTSPAEKTVMSLQQDLGKSLTFRDPLYADKQAVTAGKAKALNTLGDYFPANADATYGKLKKINDPSRASARGAVENYQTQFGGDYLDRLGQADKLRSTDHAAQFEPDIRNARQATQSRFGEIETGLKPYLAEAEAKRKAAGGLSNPKTALSTLRKYGGDPERNPFQGQDLENLANDRGIDPAKWKEDSKNLALKRAVEQSYQRGSRNTNLSAISLGGLGNLLGGEEGKTFGAMVGANVGALADIFGAKPAKMIIDYIDSPRGQNARRVYEKLASRGPAGLAAAHQQLMKTDDDYRSQFQEGTP